MEFGGRLASSDLVFVMTPAYRRVTGSQVQPGDVLLHVKPMDCVWEVREREWFGGNGETLVIFSIHILAKNTPFKGVFFYQNMSAAKTTVLLCSP